VVGASSGVGVGRLAGFAPGLEVELRRLGYTSSPARKHRVMVVGLSCWLDERGLGVADLSGPLVEPFFAARREAGVSNLRTCASLRPLLGYLRRLGVLSGVEAPMPVTEAGRLLGLYRAYLTRERGLAEGTVKGYVRVAGLFIDERAVGGGVELSGVTARELALFTAGVCAGLGASARRGAVSALRSFLRFLRLEGLVGSELEGAVLSAAGSSPSLPRAVGAEAVARLLVGCGRVRSIDLRDHAILLLLARLGLRGGEVVAVELGDIDWRAGELTVRGKGGRRDRLPLPTDVGEALAVYLQHGRPVSESRRLFLRAFAPWVGFASSGALRGVLARACVRAGVGYVSPHRLRHTAATELLRAGAPLSEISQLLRHRSAVTTAVYAKVDHDQLRLAARPWPGGAS
jgi:integrase/recombinase XerD